MSVRRVLVGALAGVSALALAVALVLRWKLPPRVLLAVIIARRGSSPGGRAQTPGGPRVPAPARRRLRGTRAAVRRGVRPALLSWRPGGPGPGSGSFSRATSPPISRGYGPTTTSSQCSSCARSSPWRSTACKAISRSASGVTFQGQGTACPFGPSTTFSSTLPGPEALERPAGPRKRVAWTISGPLSLRPDLPAGPSGVVGITTEARRH